MTGLQCDKCKRIISIAVWQIQAYIEEHGRICHNCIKKLEKEGMEGEEELFKKLKEIS